MPDGLYEQDFLVWSERQAALLRRLAQGERVNEEIDWPNVIEEVGELGLSELHGCESHIRQALIHFLKIQAFPGRASAHWRGEIVTFLAEAQARFTPSMRQRLDLEKLYQQARRQVLISALPNQPSLPDACPVTLDDLLAETADIHALEHCFAPREVNPVQS